MTAVHAAMRLGGPFLRIANAIKDAGGSASIPEIKASLESFRRRNVGRNTQVMVRLGLLIETDMQFSLTDKCKSEMESQP